MPHAFSQELSFYIAYFYRFLNDLFIPFFIFFITNIIGNVYFITNLRQFTFPLYC